MTPSRLLRIVGQRLRSIFGKEARDAELDAELQFHLEQLIAEKIAQGLTPTEARQAALRAFGNVAVVIEASRDTRQVGWPLDAAQDLRFGARLLRRAPGFTTVAVMSIGLGVGGSVALGAAMHHLLGQPLPFSEPDRLFRVTTIPPDDPARQQGLTQEEYDAFVANSRFVEAYGLSLSSPRGFGPGEDAAAEDRLASMAFTPGLLRMLGVVPARGRVFDDASSPYSPAAKVLIISDRLWRRQYGGAEDVIGREVSTDGGTRTIIGVMPPDFRLHDDNVDFWIPLIPIAATPGNATLGRPYGLTVRLHRGVPASEVEAELSAILADMVRHLPERFRGRRAVVRPLQEAMYAWTRPLLATLFGAIGLMLAIAGANITGLLLARGTTREREIWIRRSLGAGEARLLRQFLGEALWLGIGGGLLGLGVAVATLRTLASTLGPPPGQPRVGLIPFTPTMAAVVIGLAVLTALVVAVVPAVVAVRRSRSASTGATPPRGGGRRGTRVRSALVSAELALATVLLVGAGLLVGTFIRLEQRQLHFDPDKLVSFKVVVPAREFATRRGFDGLRMVYDLSPVAAETIARTHDRLRELPGVEAVGGMTYQPVNSLVQPTFQVRAADARADAAAETTGFVVTPDVFKTMRTPILAGREVRDSDTRGSSPVVVINEAAARRFFPDRPAVGASLLVDLHADAPARTVVGVVANVPVIRRRLEPEPVIYLPSKQTPAEFRGGGAGFFGEMTFMLRPSGDPATVTASARRAVADLDPAHPIVDFGVVTRALDARMPELARYVATVSAFGVVALLLAAVGVYGVTAFAVAARTTEIGVRRALGAGTRDILMAAGARIVLLGLVGIAIGLALAAGTTRLIASQLVGVNATDPATFLGVAMLMAAAALLACAAPLRRTLHVDPASVLRSE